VSIIPSSESNLSLSFFSFSVIFLETAKSTASPSQLFSDSSSSFNSSI